MRICFVGIGSIAKRHISNLRQICREDNIEVSIDALRRSESGLDCPEGISNIYMTVDDLPGGYDAIFLTNPTEYHAEMLLLLHDKGKHFFIEKPVASIRTIERLKDIPFRKGSIYYVACPLRYTDIIQYFKREIDLEKVRSVRSISSSFLPDWRPGIDYRHTYSAHKDLGGGVTTDLIHEWDYLVYLFGLPDEVKMFSGKLSNLEIDSDDYAIYIARYKKGMILELHLDYFGRQSARTIELLTDEDSIIGDFITGEVKYLKTGKVICLNSERDNYQKRELRYFIDLINGRVNNENDILDSVRTLELTQGIID